MSMLGERLRELRKKQKKTQGDIANHLDVDTATISRWERNQYEPDTSQLKQLAAHFSVSVDYLLGHTDSPSPDFRSQSHIDLREVRQALAEKPLTWGGKAIPEADQTQIREILIAILDRLIGNK
ncbi:helix-turn-helix domain-containing protein [Laceyella tengchongensis]|uniref:helix-turn-helix domain-containing protein n=1 Tax=Laceyella tengchongensis TaxID=574699 RepID=UPI0012B8AD50|nr:helix-turn-helix domain-containing protein [Laceyella tengchongensis]